MNVLSRRSVLYAMVAGLALVSGLMSAGYALAQDDSMDDPFEPLMRQATGGAQRLFVYTGSDPTMPATLSFAVLEFASEDEAIAASERLSQQLADFDLSMMTGDTTATPAAAPSAMIPGMAMATPVVEYGMAEEYDVVDGGTAYHLSLADPSFGAANAELIVIRDGRDLHVWSGVGTSMDAGASPADPHDLMSQLVEDWFGAGSRADDPMLDRLPAASDLPDGYALESESEGLDEDHNSMMDDREDDDERDGE